MNTESDNISTYLGQKGYTIYKDALEMNDQEGIRNELMAKPFVPKSSMSESKPFPIYRESRLKFYLPRHYGINTYGEPDDVKLSDGIDIDIQFKGELRDYQKPIVATYVKKAKEIGGGLLEVPCGFGKTIMALRIISHLKKKTIVIVHKEFLLRQWVDRIKEFLPGARVGRIQGQVIDIDDKDIVIGMLQSLSMKEYPREIFAEFGLTIADECHHLSAEVFSNALFRIVTKYTLGLSATMERKDGLSDVFKQFIGPIVFSKQREGDDNVLVQCINYAHDDYDFNKVVLNFKGQVHYSIMIKKLCEFNRRTEFILKVLKQTLADNEEQQIMILAHNKNVLKYLHDAIEDRKIASVGYYIGGMKAIDLEISETKKVIIATYAMAEEALDIKTLSTLIMATPKTDVRQAVGRILRQKHKQALVIDIVDSHDLFQRQWLKRKRYYKKQNYKIVETSVDDFKKHKWTVVYEKGAKNNKKSSKKSASKCNSNVNDLIKLVGNGKCLIMDEDEDEEI
jgi:superfamily II DNA or RNA helicase